MEVEIHRKLILTYRPQTLEGTQNIEMKFAESLGRLAKDEVHGRRFSLSDTDVEYAKHIKEVCSTLNKEIKKLVDNAQFHIVEVKTIR